MDFQPKINIDVDYSSVKPVGYDYDSHSAKNVSVKYHVDLVQRNWGFCLTFMSYDQTISFDLDLIANDQEDSESFTIELKLENITVEIDDSRSIKGDIGPTEMEVKITAIKKVGNSFQAMGTGTLKF